MKEMHELYGMIEVPDIIVEDRDNNKIIYTFTSLKNYSHKIEVSKLGIRYSIITINDAMFAKEMYNLLEKSSYSGVNLYFKTYKKSKSNGAFQVECWHCKNAQLIDFRYGLALDGDPAVYCYIFKGDLISSCTEWEYNEFKKRIN